MMRPTSRDHLPDAPAPWVRLADVCAAALIILACLVGLTGGFRVRLWSSAMVSVTSPLRLAILAAALLVVRHAIVRRPTLVDRLWRGIRAWWQSPEAGAAAPAFLGTRLPVLLIGYLAVIMIGYASSPPFRVSNNEFWNLPARWDTGWYLTIARHGYDPAERERRQENLAFFPAFPLLMRAGGLLLGNQESGRTDQQSVFLDPQGGRMMWVGVCIALGAFYWAMLYLYRLARLDLTHDQASAGLLFLAAYPFALFYSASYTESLFLLAVTGAWYSQRTGRPLTTGGWGLVAGLTRPNGFLLSIPLAWLALSGGPRPAADRDPPTSRVAAPHPSRRWLHLAAALAPIAGILAYSAFVYSITGSPFRWAEAQAAWGRVGRNPVYWIRSPYERVAEVGLYEASVAEPLGLLNGLAAWGVVALLWPLTRRLGVACGLFTVLNLSTPLSTGLDSLGRYTSILFPVFLYLGAAVPARHRAAWIAAFASLQAFAAALFFTWRAMF